MTWTNMYNLAGSLRVPQQIHMLQLIYLYPCLSPHWCSHNMHGGSRPWNKEGGGEGAVSKKFFSALWTSVCSKNRGGAPLDPPLYISSNIVDLNMINPTLPAQPPFVSPWWRRRQAGLGQAFEVATAQTSGLVNLVFSWQTGFWLQASIYKNWWS